MPNIHPTRGTLMAATTYGKSKIPIMQPTRGTSISIKTCGRDRICSGQAERAPVRNAYNVSRKGGRWVKARPGARHSGGPKRYQLDAPVLTLRFFRRPKMAFINQPRASRLGFYVAPLRGRIENAQT